MFTWMNDAHRPRRLRAVLFVSDDHFITCLLLRAANAIFLLPRSSTNVNDIVREPVNRKVTLRRNGR
jgi:hypothetical protein